MDPFGYLLKTNSKQAASDYIPSLIGVDPEQVRANARDPYFERIELPTRAVTALSVSRWVTFDSLPATERDPILAVKAPFGTYYIPASELFELAAYHHDDDTIEMMRAIKVTPR